ncbi:MAG: GNAT family N-acetyltransferase, partial [Christensenellaceae bacterium]|nr:GNAT family N-acetyltransferase [Christensenellaceae bacterium]
MKEFDYHEIPKVDEKQIYELYDECMKWLPSKDFFIPFSQDDLDNMFNRDFGINIGAYDGKKLVGMATLYFDQDELKPMKERLKVTNKKMCELGNYLVAKDYRGQGIIKTLQDKLIELGKQMKCNYVISTAHPENLGSVKTLLKELKIADTYEY